LASAGTGDALAGWLGGLWAQQPSEGRADDTLRVACSAVHAHGAAADASGQRVMLAGDLITALHAGF
jgi:NAD(P)H-hydrate repair Nnr-like enzyme with NAD(P)H-hydrate dehydratase domain